MKRGVSPAALSITSTSTARFKESGSSYSIKQLSDAKETNTIERNKTGNGPTSRCVLFASDVGSTSSYSINELNFKSIGANATSGSGTATPTSNASSTAQTTSQLIKQTLSPLTQHRNLSQQSTSEINSIGSALTNATGNNKNQLNNGSSSLGQYQFPSSSLNISNKTTSSVAPSRTISHNTNTLPSNVARNMLYQSDSSYSLKNYASPGNINGGGGAGCVAVGGVSGTNAISHTNNIYGTLPKTSSPFGNGGIGTGSTGIVAAATQALYGNIGSSLTTGNITTGITTGSEFEQIIARNQNHTSGLTSSVTATSTHLNNTSATFSHGNYNTLGSYRVQYSSTNPFLPSFNPNATDSPSDNRINEE